MAEHKTESDDEIVRPLKRFRKYVSAEEEKTNFCKAVPLSTRYKNQKLFEDWKRERENKSPRLEPTSFDVELESIETLDSEN